MLGKQLKFLRDLKHLSQQDVCNALNIEQSTLANYENNKRIPKIDILIKLANYYNVSLDELLGLKKMGACGNCDNYFYEEGTANWEIRKKAEELNLSYETVLERTGIEQERLNSLWFGNSQPFAEELIRFSEVLDVSIDFLLDNSQREKVSVKEEMVLRYYKEFPDEIIELLGSFVSLSRKNRTIVSGKCFELEQEESVAAEFSIQEAK